MCRHVPPQHCTPPTHTQTNNHVPRLPFTPTPLHPQVRLSVLKREEEALLREEDRLTQDKIQHMR
jgi:hypothetical protein